MCFSYRKTPFFIIYLYYCVYRSGLRTFIRVDVYFQCLVIRVDISLDNPGFNLTDAEVHHSDPPKSSWDSALRAWILDE